MVPAPENMMSDFIYTLLSPFTDLMGDWFWGIVMFAIVGVVYLRSDSWAPPMAMMMVMSSLLTTLLQTEVRYFFGLLTVLGIASLLYTMYQRRR